MAVADPDEARKLIEQDPFAKEGLIDELTVLEWSPMSGSLESTSASGADIHP